MRIATATLTIGCASARFTVDPSLPVEALFSDWKTHFSRAFSSAEEHATRLQIFAETVRSVSVHNALFDAGKSTYRQGVNQFAVYTNAEYRRFVVLLFVFFCCGGGGGGGGGSGGGGGDGGGGGGGMHV